MSENEGHQRHLHHHHDEYVPVPLSPSQTKLHEHTDTWAGEQSFFKYASLTLLVLQSSLHVIVLRFSRVSTGDMYISSTAVFLSEVLKLCVCLLITLLEIGNLPMWLSHLYVHVFGNLTDTLRVSAPALVFIVQNNLQYLALTNLDPATYQVTYQLKILTTAVFSVFFLGTIVKWVQWLALFVLFFGLAMVQLQPSQLTSSASSMDGYIAVFVSSLCSGIASVYFEKVLKQSASVSVWLRNVQLALVGTLFSFFLMLVKDGSIISQHGILFGYTKIVWFAVILQASGGLLVAVVLVYADNLLKCFATAFAIILSCVVSIYVFNFVLSVQFVLGTSLVISAIYMYHPH